VSRVRDIGCSVDEDTFTMEDVESNIVRCPDQEAAKKMIDGGRCLGWLGQGAQQLRIARFCQPRCSAQGWPLCCLQLPARGNGDWHPTQVPPPIPSSPARAAAINEVRNRGDSCGGVVTCVVRRCPKGLGTPVFDKLEAELAKAMMSLPATKGFEIGSGFSGSVQLGSEHNDEFFIDGSGAVRTRTNRSGGVQGGISNGENIVMRIAFKPTSTISRPQRTVTREGEETELRARGRHDPCVVPRAVPMVESMAAMVLADQLLQHFAQCEIMPRTSSASPDATLAKQFAGAAN
jgi:chorismate synthase